MKYEATAYSAPPMEKNDCSVRALSVAAAMPYSDAYKLFASRGRQRELATSIEVTRDLMIDIGADTVIAPIPIGSIKHGPTVAEFIRRVGHCGRYVVNSGPHTFAVVDGVVHDWSGCPHSRPRCRVWAAWRVPHLPALPERATSRRRLGSPPSARRRRSAQRSPASSISFISERNRSMEKG